MLAEASFDAGLAGQGAGEIDVGPARIKLHAGTAGSRQHTPPIGITAGKHRFYQGGAGDGACHLFGGAIAGGAAHLHLDDAAGAFSIRHNLQRQGMADLVQGGQKFAVEAILANDGAIPCRSASEVSI